MEENKPERQEFVHSYLLFCHLFSLKKILNKGMWIILIIVIVIFVLLPLGLTLLEETGELGEERQQQHNQNN